MHEGMEGNRSQTVVSSTSGRSGSGARGVVTGWGQIRGELCAELEVPDDSTESFELDGRRRIDSSDELDLSKSSFSRSSSLWAHS